MKSIAGIIALATAAGLAGEIPMDGSGWDLNPITAKTGKAGIEAAGDFFPSANLPRGRRVRIEAECIPGSADAEKGWAVAGVAVKEDERNFWHMALVQAPKKEGAFRGFELCEMREGRWLAQYNLKAVSEENHGTWQYGKSYILKIAMDERGIEGSVLEKEGAKVLYRKKIEFNAPAVTSGRPALHTTGTFKSRFSKAEAEVQSQLPDIPAPEYPPYQSDNFAKGVTAKATGYFRVAKSSDGRWWAYDPLGRGAVIAGVDHIRYNGHWCEALGYCPHERKNQRKYPDKKVWEGETLERLKAWGFTLLGAASDRALEHRGLAHTIFLGFGDTLAYSTEEFWISPNENRPCSAFPNVFHPKWPEFCDWAAKHRCAPNAKDQWLFGYFIDNELAWWGRGVLDCGLFDRAMELPAWHTAKTALAGLLKEKAGQDIARFNSQWGTNLSSFDEILSLKKLPGDSEERVAIKLSFLKLAAEKYFSVASAAIKKWDPNHLVLGARFAGTGGAHPVVWETAAKYTDVVTFNIYPWADIDENVMYLNKGENAEKIVDHFDRYQKYVGKPMLITEWSFPALDAGLPSTQGAGQRFKTQEGRVKATELFARTMLSLPYIIGYDYFMWVDEPALGISTAFPENSNYGLVDENCQPYAKLTEMFAKLQKNVAEARYAPTPAPSTNYKKPVCKPAAEAFAKIAEGEGEAKLEEKDGAYKISNSAGLCLEGRTGGSAYFTKMTLDGKPLGSYAGMLCVGSRGWYDADRLVSASFERKGGSVIMTAEARHDAGPQNSFALVQRLTIPPASRYFLCELLEIRNTGSQPLDASSAFFRLYAPFKETDSSYAPNLWKAAPTASWKDRDGRYIGFAAPASSDAVFNFWTDPSGHPHPDAFFPLKFREDLRIKPGQSARPDRIYVVCFAGTDGDEGRKASTGFLESLLQ